MRLTLQTDYGFRILIYLGVCHNRLVAAREIAETYGIALNHVSKIISQLVKGGYITSIRGRKGGIKLSRPLEEIKLGEVIECLENSEYLLRCMNPKISNQERCDFCRLVKDCKLRGVLGSAQRAFLKVMSGYTLADIATEVQSRSLGLSS